jgi:uncharacterized membrane protein
MQVGEMLRSIAWIWKGNAFWMGWNLFLALVPLAIGLIVFRARRHTAAWWLGAAAFLAFLPNAPYVLTDVIHLPRDLRSDPSWVVRLSVLFQYAVFAAAGFLAYTLALRSVVRHLLRAGWSRERVAAVEIVLHALSAAGVYLGRVDRLNSWYVLTRPAEVITSAIASMGSREAVGVMLVTFLVLAPAATMLRWAIDLVADRATIVLSLLVGTRPERSRRACS